MVAKWIEACDARLHESICYFNSTLDMSLETVGNIAKTFSPVAYADADFAGDLKTSKNTSGCYLALVGANAFIPICAISKEQGVASHSSTEIEIVALEHTLRTEAPPVLTFLGCVADICHRGTKSQMKTW